MQHIRAYALATLFLSMMPGAAYGEQSTSPDDILIVHDRAVSEDLPVGVRAGSFLLSPGIEWQNTFDDNILRTPDHPRSDFITDIKPAFAAQSDWERHSLFLGAEGDLGYFDHHTDQNYQDYGLLASGQYDITDSTALVAALSRARRHEDFGSISDPNGEMPLAYTATREQLEFKRELGVIQLDMTAQNENVSFSDTEFLDDPDDDFLSRQNKNFGATLTYEYMPANSIFVSGAYDTTDYKLPGSSDSLTADGSDWRAGFNFDNARNLNASLYGGYIFRSYQEGSPNTSDPFFGANLNWSVTPLTTLSAILDKTFNETTVAGEAGAIHTQRKLSLRQEVSERFTVDATGGLDNDDFVGGGPELSRDTRLYYGEIAGDYKVSDNFGIRAQYDIQRRTSPLISDEYLDNRVFISLVYMQ